MIIPERYNRNIIPETVRIFNFHDPKNPDKVRSYKYYVSKSEYPKYSTNTQVLEEIGSNGNNYALKSGMLNNKTGELTVLSKTINKGDKYEVMGRTIKSDEFVKEGTLGIGDLSPESCGKAPNHEFQLGLSYKINKNGEVTISCLKWEHDKDKIINKILKNMEEYSSSTKKVLKNIKLI